MSSGVGIRTVVEDPLVDLLARLYAKLPSAKVMVLRDKVLRLHPLTGGELRIGTGCSGTDIVIHAIQLVLNPWKAMFGIDIKLKHAMSRENTDYKQQFILNHFSPAHLFPDQQLFGGRHVREVRRRTTSACMGVRD